MLSLLMEPLLSSLHAVVETLPSSASFWSTALSTIQLICRAHLSMKQQREVCVMICVNLQCTENIGISVNQMSFHICFRSQSMCWTAAVSWCECGHGGSQHRNSAVLCMWIQGNRMCTEPADLRSESYIHTHTSLNRLINTFLGPLRSLQKYNFCFGNAFYSNTVFNFACSKSFITFCSIIKKYPIEIMFSIF